MRSLRWAVLLAALVVAFLLWQFRGERALDRVGRDLPKDGAVGWDREESETSDRGSAEAGDEAAPKSESESGRSRLVVSNPKKLTDLEADLFQVAVNDDLGRVSGLETVAVEPGGEPAFRTRGERGRQYAVVLHSFGEVHAVRRFDGPLPDKIEIAVPERFATVVEVEPEPRPYLLEVDSDAEPANTLERVLKTTVHYRHVASGGGMADHRFLLEGHVSTGSGGIVALPSLVPGRLTADIFRRAAEVREIPEDTRAIIFRARRLGKIQVNVTGSIRNTFLLLSSWPRARSEAAARARPDPALGGETRKMGAWGKLTFPDLVDSAYDVSIVVLRGNLGPLSGLTSEPDYWGAEELWRRNGVEVNGPPLEVDLRRLKRKGRRARMRLIPRGTGTPRGSVVVRAAVDGVVVGNGRLRKGRFLPAIHGPAVVTYLPDPNSARVHAIASGLFDLAEPRALELTIPVTVPLSYSTEIPPRPSPSVLIGTASGIPFVDIGAYVVFEGNAGRIYGLPQGGGVYHVTGAGIEPVAGLAPVGTLTIVNRASIGRFVTIHARNLDLDLFLPLREVEVPARRSVTFKLPPETYSVHEHVLRVEGVAVAWQAILVEEGIEVVERADRRFELR